MEEIEEINRKKFPGYRANDTHFDEMHRAAGLMTNREFFTSNAPGGFYEGMEWDAEKEEWVPDAASRRRTEEWERKNRCSSCGYLHENCECPRQSYDEDDY